MTEMKTKKEILKLIDDIKRDEDGVTMLLTWKNSTIKIIGHYSENNVLGWSWEEYLDDENCELISIMNGDQYPSDLCSHIHNRYLKGEFDNLSKGDQIIANVLI